LRWLKVFSKTHQRPLMYQTEVNGEWYGLGPSTFRSDVSRFLEQGGSLFKMPGI
jgi:hypothetical protein